MKTLQLIVNQYVRINEVTAALCRKNRINAIHVTSAYSPYIAPSRGVFKRLTDNIRSENRLVSRPAGRQFHQQFYDANIKELQTPLIYGNMPRYRKVYEIDTEIRAGTTSPIIRGTV